MQHSTIRDAVHRMWTADVLPSLSELIAIPALSPAFDSAWQAGGQLDAVVEHVHRWLVRRDLPGARVDVIRLPGRTPLLLVDLPPTPGVTRSDAVLFYGHLDKQPAQGEWSAGLGPWSPVVRGGRLYGRGAADDGYAGYAAITAVEAARAAGGVHSRCLLLLDTSEESGSPDLPYYLDCLRDRLGEVSLVVCLDSSADDYDRLWVTTSLRGAVSINVTVRVLTMGQHSGSASGVVPSPFRIMRQLLDRLEDPVTGSTRLPELRVPVPPERMAELVSAAQAVPGRLSSAFRLLPGVRPVSDDDAELALNNAWRATLSVIGAAGLPEPAHAANVLHPATSLMLSLRLPPTADPGQAVRAVTAALTADVPYGAHVELDRIATAAGWVAPETSPWLRAALDEAGRQVFDTSWQTTGLGVSIPFMNLLAQAYPEAQFVVTGAAGADSNAHVPDESLHLGYAQRVVAALAYLLDAHARR
jgi:acetylornithine deacetylase/succinyl-diaminopimelate desuccinylase-like protein